MTPSRLALTAIAALVAALFAFQGVASASGTFALGLSKPHAVKAKKHKHKKKHSSRGPRGKRGPMGPTGLTGPPGSPGPGATKISYDSGPITGDTEHPVGNLGPFQLGASCVPGATGGVTLNAFTTIGPGVFAAGSVDVASNITMNGAPNRLSIVETVPTQSHQAAPIEADANKQSMQFIDIAVRVAGVADTQYIRLWGAADGTTGHERCVLVGYAL